MANWRCWGSNQQHPSQSGVETLRENRQCVVGRSGEIGTVEIRAGKVGLVNRLSPAELIQAKPSVSQIRIPKVDVVDEGASQIDAGKQASFEIGVCQECSVEVSAGKVGTSQV